MMRGMSRGSAPWAAGLFAACLSGCYWLAGLPALDSEVDATPGDAATNGDAGPQGDGGFCAKRLATAPMPSFCDDFDEGRDPAMDWPTVKSPSPGSVALDTQASFSPPASLDVSVPATSQGAPVVDVVRAFPVRTHLRVELEARADVLGNSSDQVTMLALEMQDDADAASTSRSLLYNVTSAGSDVVEEQGSPYQAWTYGLPGAPPLEAWVRYVIDLDLGTGGGATLTIAIADGTVLKSVPLGQPWPAGTYQVALGLWWPSNSTAAWGFHYDDVVVVAE
jgi:hypothetical protein